MNTKVSEEHEQERMRHLGALRQHADEGGGQHEARAAGHEVAQARMAVLVGSGDDDRPSDVRSGGHGRERQVC